eukprot:93449-Chlamydomonas_euryale.AAC.2
MAVRLPRCSMHTLIAYIGMAKKMGSQRATARLPAGLEKRTHAEGNARCSHDRWPHTRAAST